MEKVDGQDLKNQRERCHTRLNNLESKIIKRFDLIVTKYSQYLSDEHKAYLSNVSLSDVDLDRKLEIIIQAEANYVETTSNQVELFK